MISGLARAHKNNTLELELTENWETQMQTGNGNGEEEGAGEGEGGCEEERTREAVKVGPLPVLVCHWWLPATSRAEVGVIDFSLLSCHLLTTQ